MKPGKGENQAKFHAHIFNSKINQYILPNHHSSNNSENTELLLPSYLFLVNPKEKISLYLFLSPSVLLQENPQSMFARTQC